MAEEDISDRERALQYAARLKGLVLIRTGDTYALAQYKLSDATLDEIELFLGADEGAEDANTAEQGRRTDLRALLKAERAMMAELEQERRKASARSTEQNATENALAEIRRRIAEIQAERSGR